jgi:hypothetical protein
MAVRCRVMLTLIVDVLGLGTLPLIGLRLGVLSPRSPSPGIDWSEFRRGDAEASGRLDGRFS